MLPETIINFYLTHAPYAHSDKPTSALSIDLKDYGWTETALTKLMRWIYRGFVHDTGKVRLKYSIANKVDDLISAFFPNGLDNCDYPTAALCINRKLDLVAVGECKCKLTETYATCFFRHIRNSIAHGNYEELSNGFLILKDQASSIDTKDPALTAVICVSANWLLQLSEYITHGAETSPELDELPAGVPANGFRVQRKVEITMEDKK